MIEPRVKNCPISSATLILTERCNLRCTYCFVGHTDETMSVDTARHAIEWMVNNCLMFPLETGNELRITLFGGEPTLVPDLCIETYEYARSLTERHGIGLKPCILSNGTHLPDKIISLLEKARRDRHPFDIQLSIDGVPELQDKQRPASNGRKSSDSIHTTVSTLKDIYSGIDGHISLHGVLIPSSISRLYDSYLYFRDVYGIDCIWFLQATSYWYTEGDVEEYTRQSELIYRDVMKRYKQTGDVRSLLGYKPLANVTQFLFEGNDRRPCGAGTHFCSIAPDGGLYLCHQLKYSEPLSRFGDIFNGLDPDRMLFPVFMDVNKEEGCATCTHPSCYRCPAGNYLDNGALSAQIRGSYCSMMKIDLHFQERLRREIGDETIQKMINMQRRIYCPKVG